MKCSANSLLIIKKRAYRFLGSGTAICVSLRHSDLSEICILDQSASNEHFSGKKCGDLFLKDDIPIIGGDGFARVVSIGHERDA